MAAKKASTAKARAAPKTRSKAAAKTKLRAAPKAKGKAKLKRWVCRHCNYIYSEKIGEPHNGIPAGTRFEDLPDTYACPICGIDPRITSIHGKVGKIQFEPLLE